VLPAEYSPAVQEECEKKRKVIDMKKSPVPDGEERVMKHHLWDASPSVIVT